MRSAPAELVVEALWPVWPCVATASTVGQCAAPFTLRILFPANSMIAPHFHTAIEHVTVISGTFNVGHGEKFDKKKSKPLGRGDVAIMQPKTPHFGWVDKETIVQVHGVGPWTVTFVNPADDPRKKK